MLFFDCGTNSLMRSAPKKVIANAADISVASYCDLHADDDIATSNRSTIALVSISIPRKGKTLQGPTVLSGENGTPNFPAKNLNFWRRKEQSLEFPGPTNKNRRECSPTSKKSPLSDAGRVSPDGGTLAPAVALSWCWPPPRRMKMAGQRPAPWHGDVFCYIVSVAERPPGEGGAPASIVSMVRCWLVDRGRDILFNAQYPELPPDFIFGEDAEFLPEPSALPSLAGWDAADPECLLQVVKELVQQYHQYQCSRLSESSRLMFEYQTLLEEPQYGENMEIYAGKKNNWTGEFSARFLLKLPVDFSNIPIYLLKNSDVLSRVIGVHVTTRTGGLLSDVTTRTGGLLSDVTTRTGGLLSDVTSRPGGHLRDVTTRTGGHLRDVTTMGLAASSVMSPPGQAASSVMSPPGQAASSVMSPPGQAASSVMSPPGQAASSVMSPPGQAASSVMSPPGQAASSVMSPPGQAASSVMSPPGQAASSVMSPPGQVASSVMSPPGQAASSVMSPPGQAASSVMSRPGQAASSVMSPPGQAASSVMSPPGQAASSLMSPSL
ncbi:unnamed protein product, partial [Ranitomeya imitator]